MAELEGSLLQMEDLTTGRGRGRGRERFEMDEGLAIAPDSARRIRRSSAPFVLAPSSSSHRQEDMRETGRISSTRAKLVALQEAKIMAANSEYPRMPLEKERRSPSLTSQRRQPRSTSMPIRQAEARIPQKPVSDSTTTSSSSSSPKTTAPGTVRQPPEVSNWVTLAVNLIMWRDIPRSALLFGVGCFAIFSASLMQTIDCSVVSILSHLSLLYLALVFVRHNFMGGEEMQSAMQCELSEADVMQLVRTLRPAINAFLMKFGELFSGEPVMTFKVASLLWLLVQVGYSINSWTLLRLAYFALFMVPKCYSCYHSQFNTIASGLWLWGLCKWEEYSHKKALMAVALILAWNFSSASAFIFGAFMFVVALRVYNESIGGCLDGVVKAKAEPEK